MRTIHILISLILLSSCSVHNEKESLIVKMFYNPKKLDSLFESDISTKYYMDSVIFPIKPSELWGKDIDSFNKDFYIKSYGVYWLRKNYFEQYEDFDKKYQKVTIIQNENPKAEFNFNFAYEKQGLRLIGIGIDDSSSR